MVKSNYIVYDTETGGLEYKKAPITQYAAVILDGLTLKEIDRYETYLKPYAGLEIDPVALAKTQVTMSDVNNGIKVKDFVKTVTKWWDMHNTVKTKKEMGRLVPVGHNVPFDNGFIQYALDLCDAGLLWNYHFPNIIDTMSLAKITWGLDRVEKINLGSCCERCNIKLIGAHGAMNDVEATADLFRWYMKKLRGNVAVAVGSGNSRGRKTGNEFFEFKCAKDEKE